MIAGCAALPKDFDRPESYALANTENTAFGKARVKERAVHLGKSGFHLLSNGLDAFVARAVLSQYAERSIDVQYYLYHNDLVGRLFTDLLLKAADRGVRVRILANSLASNDVEIVHAGYKKYRKKLLRSGVELYALNKKLTRKQRKDKKGAGGSSKASLHTKSFVFDRKQVFIGSLNLDPGANRMPIFEHDRSGLVNDGYSTKNQAMAVQDTDRSVYPNRDSGCGTILPYCYFQYRSVPVQD